MFVFYQLLKKDDDVKLPWPTDCNWLSDLDCVDGDGNADDDDRISRLFVIQSAESSIRRHLGRTPTAQQTQPLHDVIHLS